MVGLPTVSAVLFLDDFSLDEGKGFILERISEIFSAMGYPEMP